VLLAVAKKAIQCPDAIGHKVMRFQEVEVLELDINNHTHDECEPPAG
jgi:hypothetical protein